MIGQTASRRALPILPALALLLTLGAWTAGPQRGPAGEPGRLDPGLATTGSALQRVVVQGVAGAGAAVAAAVRAAGGVVEAELAIVDGVAARVPASRLAQLSSAPGVRAVTADRVGRVAATSWDAAGVASSFVRTVGAGAAWTAGNYGRGVGIAVVDTGISEMPDFAGRLVHGPDLSGEGSVVDTYGHGTVMAGAAAGDGSDSAGRAGGAWSGMAPEATLVGVKVAGRNGAADVSTMLQALHWVSAYRSALNIRVLSLSWGVASTQNPAIDPVDYAVERLWREGIVVVVAAGNSGPSNGTVLKPGDDPMVITVGAYDDAQTLDESDDSVPAWTSRGPTAQGLAKPDVVAPGRWIVAQRSYGSTIEQDNTAGLQAPSYIRGSGSSQATAITAGAVALLLAARPELTPDQVKRVLTSTARSISGADRRAQGAGRISVARALTASAGPAMWQVSTATGLGSLEASRAGVHVSTDCSGTTRVIEGEMDVRCEPWTGSQWTGSQWTGSQWTGSQWTGSQWTGSQWTGSQWTGSQWTGSQWTGSQWTGSQWTGGSWTGASWQGAAWTGSQWTGSQWTGSQWTGSQWTGSQWTGSQWTGSQWTSAPGGDGAEHARAAADWGTAFYGHRPPWWRAVPGERSEDEPPPHGRAR